jgi:hypothetical protein
MQGRAITRVLMAMVIFTFACADLQAEVLEIAPAMDTTLFEDEDGRLGNGSGQYLFIGRTWDENGIDKLLRRAVIKFDLSSLPRGSTINAASFSITIDQVPPAATGAVITLHSITSDWGEGASNAPGPEGRGTLAQADDATWLHTFWDSGFWTTPGGDFAAGAVASESISSSPQSVTFNSSPLLVNAVQGWVDEPASNYGWILLGDEVFMQNARRILSRENTNPGGPLLTVEYTAPPPAAIPALTKTGLMVLVLSLLLLSRTYLLRKRLPVNGR